MQHYGFYLFGVLHHFQHCTGHITTGSWKGKGNQYIELVRDLYCKLPTNGKQLPAFPLEAMTGIEPRPQRWETRVLPLCLRGPSQHYGEILNKLQLCTAYHVLVATCWNCLYKLQLVQAFCISWNLYKISTCT